MENILLSYPQSGNHLVRFFIELLSEIPTYGCKENEEDREIYKNIFPEKVPFNISDFDKKDCYIKYHLPPLQNIRSNKLILIIRNPKEVLLRHNNYKLNIKNGLFPYETYFKNIDFYNNHKGEKLLLYYEDIITNKPKFINTLYDFLDVNNIEKKNYVLSNIDKLYDLSLNGKNQNWGGINSNSINYYYKKIPESIKPQFDNYLNGKLEKYPFLNKKYNIKINSILYLHVGKTCGSSIKHIFKNKLTTICHLNKPSIKNLDNVDLIIISIRDPIERFISAFQYVYNIINYDISNLNKNSDFSKLIAPYHIKNKVVKGYAYNKEYNDLINYFKTPNKLAESLTNNDKNKAYKLMTNNTEHIYKSLGYYTNNGEIIKKYHDKIEIISNEFFNEDINKIYNKIYHKNYTVDKEVILRKTVNKNTNLSKLAIQNLYNFFKDTDYRTIEIMYKYNLISNELYHKYVSKSLIGEIIISFCNYDYVELAEIWVAEIAKLNITNYIIISADQKTFEHLKSKNINTELRNYDKKESFWVYRIKVIQSFLEKNTYTYLVHSDLDAIWKKNICEELFNENNNTDLFFSQGTTFPEEHLKKHKFVLCCGFFCVKYNEKTIQFMNKYINNLIKIKDDQKAINLELINTKWNISNDKCKSLPNKKYVYYDNNINGYNPDYDINILLISFNKIQREFLNNNGYIYHILTPKICSKKINLFKKLKII